LGIKRRHFTNSAHAHHIMLKRGDLMSRSILVFALFAVTAVALAAKVPSTPVSPVLVELFTSEGCSSCPPADAILAELDRAQPVRGAQAIVLSEHVDYWNHDGWRDPYSSSFFTDRQEEYAHRFGLASPYTPQMVVDGAAQFSGSDGRKASEEITRSEGAARIPVELSIVASDANGIRLKISTSPNSSSPKHKGNVYVALALNHADSQVAAGENKGRHLSHVAVVQSIKKVGSLEKNEDFYRELVLPVDPKLDRSNLRVIAFVQEPDQGRVLGVAMQMVEKH